MLYNVAIALRDREDIQCVRTIVETMSFSFHAVLIPLDAQKIENQMKDGRVDLLILDLADREIGQLAEDLRQTYPGLWMILLDSGQAGAPGFAGDGRSVLLQKPISTMRMLHALHTAAAGLSQEDAALSPEKA